MKLLITIVLLSVSLSASAYDYEWQDVQDRRDYEQHQSLERQYLLDQIDHNQQIEYEIRRERVEEQHDDAFESLCSDNPYC